LPVIGWRTSSPGAPLIVTSCEFDSAQRTRPTMSIRNSAMRFAPSTELVGAAALPPASATNVASACSTDKLAVSFMTPLDS